MAFTNFYIDQASGASDLNAGSTSANAGGSSAALVTYAGGTFVRATGVFTVASGNPASDGVSVGMYASVYTTSGAVAATFVAQVTDRDATTITVDVATLKWGVATSVSETAAATTCKVGGAWTSEVVLAATGLGTFTVPVSTKVNFTGNLAVAASRTISMAGATTAPLWFSAYTTTPGDLDSDTANALAKPVWTFGSNFQLQTTGAHHTWSGLSLVGNRSGAIWQTQGASFKMLRCRGENTSSNSSASVIDNTNNVGQLYAYCWFKAPPTANSLVLVGTGSVTFLGCVGEGGGTSAASFNGANQSPVFLQCVSLNSAGVGFLLSTSASRLIGCTVYNSVSDGLKWSSAPGALSMVVGCLFNACGGYGINNASGTDTNNVFRACNDFYSCSQGPENGFGDSPAFFGQTDSSAVVTSATDMTPVVGSNARNNGFPGVFENQSFTSYQNIGAVQRAIPRLGFYNRAKKEILNGTLDLDTTTLKATLVLSTYVFNADLQTLDDGTSLDVQSHEAAGVTRQTLSGRSVTEDDVTDVAALLASRVTFPAVTTGQTLAGMVLYRDVSSDDTQSVPVAWYPFTLSTTGADVEVAFDSNIAIRGM